MFVAAAAEAASKSSGSALTFPILIVLVFVGFYFLMIRPQRRRQQQVQQQQRTVQPGARVRTTAAAALRAPTDARAPFVADAWRIAWHGIGCVLEDAEVRHFYSSLFHLLS